MKSAGNNKYRAKSNCNENTKFHSVLLLKKKKKEKRDKATHLRNFADEQ